MSLKDLTVYYAHPMSWYDTPDEEADLVILRGLFGKVVNPNIPALSEAVRDLRASGQGHRVMEPFIDTVRLCDAVAVRPFKDGKIGAGVAQEALTAKVFGLGLFMLPCIGRGEFKLSRVLTIEETRARIKAGDL